MMARLAVLCAFLDLILFAAGEGKSKPVLDLKLLKHSIPAEKLQCYHCQQDQHGCFSLANISQVPVVYCSLDQPHCMVRRLETGGRLTEFLRSCAEECSPGCEWGVTFIKCISCCNTSRCNVDSSATKNLATTLVLVLTLAHILLLFFVH